MSPPARVAPVQTAPRSSARHGRQHSRGHGHGFRIHPRTHGGEQHGAPAGQRSRVGGPWRDSAARTTDPTGSTGPEDLPAPADGPPGTDVRSDERVAHTPVRTYAGRDTRTTPAPSDKEYRPGLNHGSEAHGTARRADAPADGIGHEDRGRAGPPAAAWHSHHPSAVRARTVRTPRSQPVAPKSPSPQASRRTDLTPPAGLAGRPGSGGRRPPPGRARNTWDRSRPRPRSATTTEPPPRTNRAARHPRALDS